ncbi:hypothetical protein I6G56_20305 [Burkholderia humptydooensis]|uniref:Uncharacterized protein n=1 Tax=Burkholderia humptydooensis TaxID=430531 RepID=A0A7U4P9G0_9BURK|nr:MULTISPECIES: hypothetical protein [Burkholderia]AJY39136.1 hypothetical protein BW21_6026 [Burkholderia sp. 2002721687]ALX45359.1 hypothetical protein AQ610_23080 [Burkholderia humptydooensis]QPS46834.1 hypothetical protein I6G56_20305 [Burkholderia humptydooensis]
MTPLQTATHVQTDAVDHSTERDAPKPSTSLDEIMRRWLIDGFKQQVMFPDPDDPSACPTFDGNGSW